MTAEHKRLKQFPRKVKHTHTYIVGINEGWQERIYGSRVVLGRYLKNMFTSCLFYTNYSQLQKMFELLFYCLE
jgi:hypothetical protein